MKLTMIAVATAFALSSTAALAQPGTDELAEGEGIPGAFLFSPEWDPLRTGNTDKVA
jgi:hypothetical protein